MVEDTAGAVLSRDAVRLGLYATDKLDALRQSGALLVEIGAVEEPYADAILEREESVSTYLGEGVAIPHGTDASRTYVKRTALAVLQFPDGVDWGDGPVMLCIAIASNSNEHVSLLAALANILIVPEQAERLRTATDPDEVLALLHTVADKESST